MQAKNTTRLLKAEDIRGLGSKVAFNFEDVRRSCDEYVEQIRQQTREMIETTQAETENVRRNAYSEGLAAGNPQIRVKLHPDDLAHLGDGAAEVVRTLAACGEATLVPDASLSPGGCLVETQHGIIDARLETQLDRIVSELVGDEG